MTAASSHAPAHLAEGSVLFIYSYTHTLLHESLPQRAKFTREARCLEVETSVCSMDARMQEVAALKQELFEPGLNSYSGTDMIQ